MEPSRDPASTPPSPVSSNRRLWSFELAFTACGQFGEGRRDLRVFDQDVY